jgi:DNA-binding beta-propeller fold protein YncE
VPFAVLPASVAAFHLAEGPDGCLYVTAPTLSPCDSVYRVDQNGKVESLCSLFGRPQGLAFDAHGHLYVVEALAGLSGIYRVDKDGTISLVLAALGLVGLAFDPSGGMIVVSNDTAYRLNVPLLPFRG